MSGVLERESRIAVFCRGVRVGFLRKVAHLSKDLKEVREGAAGWMEEEHSHRGNCQCKHPKAGACLVYSRNCKQTCVARAKTKGKGSRK